MPQMELWLRGGDGKRVTVGMERRLCRVERRYVILDRGLLWEPGRITAESFKEANYWHVIWAKVPCN